MHTALTFVLIFLSFCLIIAYLIPKAKKLADSWNDILDKADRDKEL